MKKKLLTLTLALTMVASLVMPLAGCGSSEPEPVDTVAETVASETPVTDVESVITPTPEPTKEIVVEENTEESESADEEDSSVNETEEEPAELEVDMTKVKEIKPAKTLYTQKSVNVRKGPSTDYDIIGHFEMNQEIQAIGQDQGGWYEFMYNNEVAFISNDFVGENPIDLTALAAAAQAAQAQQAAQATAQTPVAQEPAAPAQAPAAAAAPAVTVKAPAGVLFIGDSRCVQMKGAVAGGGCSWIAQNGARYEWFADTAIPQADGMVGKGTKVVICMGVNDTGDCSKYAQLASAKAAQWAARGAKVYYCSVNPVSENPYTSQEQVDFFNSSIIGQLIGIRYIDTNSYIKGAGYRLVDGLHYDEDTYRKLFAFIIASL